MKKVLCLIAVIIIAVPFVGAQTRDLDGSTVVYTSQDDTDPNAVIVVFTATQVSVSTEWFQRVTLNLPAPWTIVSVASSFDVSAGVGTATATFSDDAYATGPCGGVGENCGAGCLLTVVINPNGNPAPGLPVTWMVEGDTWGTAPNSVICSTSDPCSHDACYDTLGIDQTAADIGVFAVPVELMTFSIE